MKKTTHALVSLCTAASFLLQPMVAYARPTRSLGDVFNGIYPLSNAEVLQESSSGPLSASRARVIVDNDAAFVSKLDAINSARSSIRMTYYIWTDDESSSVISEALIAAAKRGVKVQLMLDYLTNYKFVDLLSALEREGQGNIEIRLFGRPTESIKKDVIFMTMACSQNSEGAIDGTCSREKLALSDQIAASQPNGTFLSRLFLAGLYSKNATAIKTALLQGTAFDPSALKGTDGKPAITPEEKDSLIEFVKLVYDAKFKNSIEAKIKLAAAFALYGSDVGPVYDKMTRLLPLDRQTDDMRNKEWSHITDFTHHKLLAVDSRIVQLGGRNIENSYHMKPNRLVGRYLFKDTDMYVELNSGGRDIELAYDNLFNFTPMVVSLAQARAEAPMGPVANPQVVNSAIQKCKSQVRMPVQFNHCIETNYEAALKKSVASKPRGQRINEETRRMNEALVKMRTNAETYRKEYQPTIQFTDTWRTGGSDELSPADVEKMLLTYIENVPYKKSLPLEQRQRIYGANNGYEEAEGKHIHSLLLKSLQEACTTSKAGKRKSVYLHQGYVLFPTNVMRALGRMINQEEGWRCGGLDIMVLTNSFATTDLNVINVVARHQLKALFDQVESRPMLGNKVTFRYYELNKPKDESFSLHTKVNIVDQDAVIGSANADLRSYVMDTNNGFFVRGATDFVKTYTSMLNEMIGNPAVTTDLGKSVKRLSHDQILQQDREFVRQLVARFYKNKDGSPKVLSPERQKKLDEIVTNLMSYTYYANRGVLDSSTLTDIAVGNDNESKRLRDVKQKDLEEEFNHIFMYL